MARSIDIFISHATEDLERAEQLCRELERTGWSVFLAARDLPAAVQGADWSARIDQALVTCRLLVLLVSPDALRKEWVTHEWRTFHHDVLRRQPVWLIPVCIRDVAPGALEHPLTRYQAVDMRDPGRADHAMSSLLVLIESHLKRPVATRGPRRHRRALALSGTGVRVVLTEHALGRLEQAVGGDGARSATERLGSSFDLVFAGSASAFLGGMLLLGMSHDERLSRLDAVLRSVFMRSIFRLGVIRSKFSSAELVRQMQAIFGSRTLGDVPQLVIGTVDLRSSQSILWSALPGLGPGGADTPLAPLMAASMASPIWFEGIELEIPGHPPMRLFDGALWDPDSAVSALAALRLHSRPTPLLTDITLVSLGEYTRPPAGSMPSLAVPLVVAVSALAQGVDAHRRRAREQLLEQFRAADSFDRFVALEPALSDAEASPGDDDPDALTRLSALGAAWADSHTPALADLAARLLSGEQ